MSEHFGVTSENAVEVIEVNDIVIGYRVEMSPEEYYSYSKWRETKLWGRKPRPATQHEVNNVNTYGEEV